MPREAPVTRARRPASEKLSGEKSKPLIPCLLGTRVRAAPPHHSAGPCRPDWGSTPRARSFRVRPAAIRGNIGATTRVGVSSDRTHRASDVSICPGDIGPMNANVHEPDHGAAAGLRWTTALGALGIVYGDIGTSPLYALKEAVKAASSGAAATGEAATGAVSVILWSLILIVSIKYAVLILRADNRGEGGIVAMLALLRAREARPGHLAGRAAGAGADRRRPAVRGRGHHAGHLGPVGRRGPQGRRAGARPLRPAHHGGGPGRAVPGATPRHGLHRPGVRADHAVLVRGDRADGPARHRHAAPDPPGGQSGPRPLVHDRGRAGGQFRGARGGLPGRDRRRGHVCGHGSFRQPSDPARLVRGGAAVPHAELSRPGCPADRRPHRARKPLLPAGARLGPLSSRGLRHRRHRHRQPGPSSRAPSR